VLLDGFAGGHGGGPLPDGTTGTRPVVQSRSGRYVAQARGDEDARPAEQHRDDQTDTSEARAGSGLTHRDHSDWAA